MGVCMCMRVCLGVLVCVERKRERDRYAKHARNRTRLKVIITSQRFHLKKNIARSKFYFLRFSLIEYCCKFFLAKKISPQICF